MRSRIIVSIAITFLVSFSWAFSCHKLSKLEEQSLIPPWAAQDLRKLNDHLLRAYSGRQNPINSLYDYALERYSPEIGSAAYQALEAKNFSELITDPGIVMRMDDFIEFANAHPEIRTPWKMRQAYSDHLGFKTVYRGMKLTDWELKQILANGITSNKSRRSTKEEDTVSAVAGDLQYHSSGVNYSSNYISVTSYPTLAVAVSKGAVHTQNASVYLFKLKIPALDLVHFDTTFRNPHLGSLSVRINLSRVDIDQDLESFAIGRIPGTAIVKVQKIGFIRKMFSTYNHIDKEDGLIYSIIREVFPRPPF